MMMMKIYDYLNEFIEGSYLKNFYAQRSINECRYFYAFSSS